MDLSIEALRICMRELRGNNKRLIARVSAELWRHFAVEHRVHRRQRLKSYLPDGTKLKVVVDIDGQRHNGCADGLYAFTLYRVAPLAMDYNWSNASESFFRCVHAYNERSKQGQPVTGLYIDYKKGRALTVAWMFLINAESMTWYRIQYLRHSVLDQDDQFIRLNPKWHKKNETQCYLIGKRDSTPYIFYEDELLMQYLQIALTIDLPFYPFWGDYRIEKANDLTARNHNGSYICHFK